MGKYAMHSGRLIDPRKIKLEDLDIQDIAHHLAKIQRYGGALPLGVTYCVAEHSINLANYFKEKGYSDGVQLLALMHDATEAYLGDIVSPLKTNLKSYLSLEKKLDRLIRIKFGVIPHNIKQVFEADRRIVMDEVLAMMPDKWNIYSKEMGVSALGCSVEYNNHPGTAKECFLTKFKELTGGLNDQYIKNRAV